MAQSDPQSSVTVSPASPAIGTQSTSVAQTSPAGVPQGHIVPLNLAHNLSGIQAVPFALPVQTGIPQMPMAINPLAVPSGQQTPGNVQALAQSLQTNNTGSSIIVLNVGNGSNLAAALSQLGSLIQQPSGQVPQPAASTTAVTVTQAVTSAVIHDPTTSVASSPATPSTPVATTMNSQPSTPVTPQMMPQMPFQQTPTMSIPPQAPQQQQQQQQPAAFMLVPIPQVPTGQTLQQNVAYPTHGQAPVIVSPANQVPTCNQYQPVQHQVQSSTVLSVPHQNYAVNHSQPSSQVQALLPKSDELRSFLMRSTASSTLPVQHQQQTPLATSTMQNLSYASQLTTQVSFQPQQHLTTHSSPVSMTSTHLPMTPTKPPPQIQTPVSSPALAFLAQVSSLTPHEQVNASTATGTSIANTAPLTNTCFQDLIAHEVNNNLPILGLDEVKDTAPVHDDCETVNSIVTVSSTTKLEDDSSHALPAILRDVSRVSTDVALPEIIEIQENSPSHAHVGQKRKKEIPVIIREKKKKGPAPKLNGDEVCLICGDKASGFHYNALSCEGCKGFFRRSVFKSTKYQCKSNGDCTMDLYMRRKCQKCRYEKCKAAGMREESVLSEEKIKGKKLKKECDVTVSPVRTLGDDSPLPKLTPQQRSLLELLNANERRFQWPTTEDMKKVTVWVEGDDTPHSRALRFAHFTELCILIVQLVVEFTKQLPGFLTVLREDQIVLLKACAIEVMLLRAAKQYNKHDGTINFLNGKLYDKSTFYKAGMQVEFVDPIFQFCSSMAQLDLDETEYAILVAINTFSTDRPHIKDIGKVECMQDPYVELLRVYSRIRHPDDPLMFARILMKIVELRTLNNYHSEQIFALKVQDKKLPPLLAEIWDM